MFLSDKKLNPINSFNKKTNKNNKNYNENKNENELLVFGYSCHIFRDDSNAERLDKENGDLLIPWHDDEDYSLYLDRYDVRNLIEDKITLEEMEKSINVIDTEENLYDEERYLDLDSEEEKLNEMSEEEREIYLEIKRERKQKEKEEQEQEKEDDDVASDDSIDIEKPSTDQQRKIIEKTAKFITESSNPQMEIVIQAKQSSNPLFNFLNKNDILYPYYQRICLLMRMGIYTYSEEELINANKNEKDENGSKNEEIENKKETISNEEIKNIEEENNIKDEEEIKYRELEKKIPDNIRIIIEKMANYIARNGSEFETLVRQKNIGDERFSFMQPWNEFYSYYKFKINKCSIIENNKSNIPYHSKISLNSKKATQNNDNVDENNNNNNDNDDDDSNKNNNNNNNNNSNDNNNKEISLNITLELNEKSQDMKEIKAKRLLKMKEIIARKKLKKN